MIAPPNKKSGGAHAPLPPPPPPQLPTPVLFIMYIHHPGDYGVPCSLWAHISPYVNPVLYVCIYTHCCQFFWVHKMWSYIYSLRSNRYRDVNLVPTYHPNCLWRNHYAIDIHDMGLIITEFVRVVFVMLPSENCSSMPVLCTTSDLAKEVCPIKTG